MSILKVDGAFCLICDNCGGEHGDSFAGFYDAVDHKKDNGWKSRRNGNEWEDVCPECLEGSKER